MIRRAAVVRRRRSLASFVIVFCIVVKLSAKKPFVVSPSFIAVVCRRRLHRRQPLPQDCKAGQSANATGGLMRDNPKRSEASILFLLFSPPFLPPFSPGAWFDLVAMGDHQRRGRRPRRPFRQYTYPTLTRFLAGSGCGKLPALRPGGNLVRRCQDPCAVPQAAPAASLVDRPWDLCPWGMTGRRLCVVCWSPRWDVGLDGGTRDGGVYRREWWEGATVSWSLCASGGDGGGVMGSELRGRRRL